MTSPSALPSQSTHVRWHVLVAGFGCYGFDAVDFMILALALPAMISEWHLTLAQAGLLGTAGMIGVGLSSVVLGWYADNQGRRRALLLSVCIFAVMTALVAGARSPSDVLWLRFLAGLGLGGVWGVISTLINETWPRSSRGRATALVLGAWPVGVSAVALLAKIILPQYGWRPLFLCGAAALIAALYVWLFVPESPVWLQQRQQDAGRVRPARIADIFSPALASRTLLGTLAAACALIGYWGTNSWLPTYLVRERGLDVASMATFVVLLNVGMFIGYQLLGLLSDSIGRRRSLLVCFAGATILLPLYALIRDNTLLFWVGPVVALFFAYAGPFGAYFPELYPTRVRTLGAGFCFNVGRGIAAFAPYALGKLADHVGLSASIALSAVGFLLAGLVTLALPEHPAQGIETAALPLPES